MSTHSFNEGFQFVPVPKLPGCLYLICIQLNSPALPGNINKEYIQNQCISLLLHNILNCGPAEPGYARPLQTAVPDQLASQEAN